MMKKILAFAIAAIVLSFATSALFYYIFASGSLYPNPQNSAQKIANFVFQNGKAEKFNDGTKDDGVSYTYNLYSGNQLFEIQVYVFNSGEKSLDINYFLSNRPMEEFKTPADAVAHELKFGRTEIHIEEHIYDKSMDMEVDLFQQFIRKDGPVYMGFTREERDLGKKAGVSEYIFEDKSERAEKGWQKASDKTLAEIKEAYGMRLFAISEKLKIK